MGPTLPSTYCFARWVGVAGVKGGRHDMKWQFFILTSLFSWPDRCAGVFRAAAAASTHLSGDGADARAGQPPWRFAQGHAGASGVSTQLISFMIPPRIPVSQPTGVPTIVQDISIPT